MDTQQIYSKVAERYSAASRGTNTGYGDAVAQAFGYSAEELASIPKDANLGLSCGNPLALASVREGETVIDLGSGAGLDVFLAAKRVGPGGKVIGVDMNKEMLAKANALRESSGASNTEFVESPITNIALPDGVADCIISNCVINLVPEAEKPLVFHEMARLLKPSGRIAVSDILARKQLPHTIRNNVALYVSCVAGASLVGEYETWLTSAGFADLLISDAGGDLNVYLEAAADGTGMAGSKECESCCGKLERADAERVAGLAAELKDFDMNEWVGSFKIYAVKK